MSVLRDPEIPRERERESERERNKKEERYVKTERQPVGVIERESQRESAIWFHPDI